MANKRILITGGSGKLGSLLVNRLVNEGHSLRILTRKQGVISSDSRIEYFNADLTDNNSLNGIGDNIDQVLHLAALTHSNSANDYFAVNVFGTQNLLDKIKEHPVERFVFFGSRADNPKAGEYSLSKHRATQAVFESNLPYVILRPAEIYGIAGEGLALVEKLMTGYPVIPVFASRAAKVAPAHVNDIINATLVALCSARALGHSFTLAGPEEYTLAELSNLAKHSYGIRKLNVPVSIAFLRMLAWLQQNARSPAIYRDQVDRLLSPKDIDISHARNLLSYNPGSIKDNLNLVFPSLTNL